jgi:sulfur transfer protein SufE
MKVSLTNPLELSSELPQVPNVPLKSQNGVSGCDSFLGVETSPPTRHSAEPDVVPVVGISPDV